jgi:sirohydrochlorin ferrochelatase
MNRAIVLIDHGSRRAEANDALEEVAEAIRGIAGESLVVATAHMEIVAPTLRDALVACVEAGAREIVVVPYFLSPGRHVSEDIPAMAEEAARGLEDVRVRVTAPLGPDEALARLALVRVGQSLDSE